MVSSKTLNFFLDAESLNFLILVVSNWVDIRVMYRIRLYFGIECMHLLNSGKILLALLGEGLRPSADNLNIF